LLQFFTVFILSQVYQAQLPSALPSEAFFPPTLIIGGFADSNHVIDDDLPLPLVAVVPFRTAREAVTLVNNSRYGMAASVWTENITLALEVANQLQVRPYLPNIRHLKNGQIQGGSNMTGTDCV
jgi:acyl-CoA reductase-like NAD-dependent aldehyde dehydrogenase